MILLCFNLQYTQMYTLMHTQLRMNYVPHVFLFDNFFFIFKIFYEGLFLPFIGVYIYTVCRQELGREMDDMWQRPGPELATVHRPEYQPGWLDLYPVAQAGCRVF